MSFRVRKRLGGYSCCHRQWRDDGHCAFLHGYDRWVEIEWEGDRDAKGWVVDFGGLKEIKDWFDYMYDHTTLIAADDPALDTFHDLAERKVIDLRVTDPTMEGMAALVATKVQTWTKNNYPTARVVRVECWENEKNCAVWTP